MAAVAPAPVPELSDEQIFELLHGKLAELVGATGQWTLVPRRSDDTDVIFHGLKAGQIATMLSGILATEKAILRGEMGLGESALRDKDAAEPTALSWTPAPISVWAEPAPAPRETAAVPVLSAA